MPTVVRNLWNLDTARSVLPRLEIADTFWKRSVGLLGRRSLPSDSGLWISPCNGIHTLGMLFAIDVLFLNEEGEVIRLIANLKPWRFCGPVVLACTVVEMPAGTISISHITLGSRLMLNNADEPVFRGE